MLLWHKRLTLLLVFCLLTACKVELNSGLEEREANEVLGRLLSANIQASKTKDKDNKVTLFVDESQFAEAVTLLKKLGLPRKNYVTMGDVFAADGLVSSPLQEQARFNFAQTQGLARTISSMPGISLAEVHIANPVKHTPFDDPGPPSASVFVLADQDQIAPDLIPKIKQLVAFSIENVAYDRVGVIVSPVEIPQPEPAELVRFAGIELPRHVVGRVLGLAGGVALASVAIGCGGTFLAQWVIGRKGRGAGT